MSSDKIKNLYASLRELHNKIREGGFPRLHLPLVACLVPTKELLELHRISLWPANHIPLRYLIAFIYPITATIKPFLARKGHADEEVEKMYQAWFKSVVLQVTLWSAPYARQEF